MAFDLFLRMTCHDRVITRRASVYSPQQQNPWLLILRRNVTSHFVFNLGLSRAGYPRDMPTGVSIRGR